MRILIKPRPLSGEMAAIPAKADAHRKLICAALADAPTHISPAVHSGDITATVSCLRQLGASIQRQEKGFAVMPVRKTAATPLLDCGESGATLRFLLPVAAALASDTAFAGQGRLPERPHSELIDCLQNHGIIFSAAKLPFTISGKLRGGLYHLPGHISSQYLSGLLLALPLAQEDSEIRLSSPLQSRGYVDMTLDTLRQFSICVGHECVEQKAGQKSDIFHIPGRQVYRSPGYLTLEGDWSNAAFFLAAGAIGGPLCLRGLNEASCQRDKEILALLTGFGARVERLQDSVTVRRGHLRGMDIDLADIPDLAPVLAVLGALAMGRTRLYNAERLRLKESDRLMSIAAMLSSLGARLIEGRDSLIIEGQPALAGGTIKSHGDHRIVMAAALAATACQNDVAIIGAEAVNKSYPAFFADYQSLGGEAYDVKLG